jgi:hypothetical protein
VAVAGELGRVEHDQVELAAGRGHFGELVEDVGAGELHAGEAVQFRVLLGQRDRRAGRINAEDGRGAGVGGVQTEAAGVTEGVEDRAASRVSGDGEAVAALVQVKARLLALGEIHAKPQSGVFDRDRLVGRRAPERAVMQLNAFEFADAAFGPQVDAVHAGQLGEESGEHLAAKRQAERCELHGEPAVVTIDRESGEPIAFAEDEPARAPGDVEAEYVAAKADGRREPFAEERFVQRPVHVPGVESDADFAAAVEKPAGDEIACGRDEFHFVAVFRIADDFCDGPGIHPRVTAEKRLSATRLEDDSRGGHDG